MHRAGLAALVVAAVMAFAAPANASPDGYTARPADGTFRPVDLGTGVVGASLGGPGDIRGLAMRASDGLVYGVDGQFDNLVRITPSPFAVQVVGSLGVDVGENNGVGLAFTADGRLWLSGLTQTGWQLFSVNPDTGAATLVGSLQLGATNTEIGGLAGSCDGTLYGAGLTNLFRIDTATGALTDVGAYGQVSLNTSSKGLDFDAAGVLHGIDENGANFTLDTTTGAATLGTPLSAPTTGMTGLAIAPIVSCIPPTTPATALAAAGPLDFAG